VSPKPEPTVALEIKGIQKRFKQYVALHHIDLQLYDGELLCFLGPSGCGKTTLLRLIAGLDEVDQGQILKNGVDISRLKTEKRRCGIVFQNYALFPNLTVAENIAYGLAGRHWNSARRNARVAELLALIGLTGSEQKYPLQLSGGQQQRVALARALAPEPDLLLLDEPLSALDARVRLHLRQEIRSLQQRLQLPTILVTHDQEEALTLADRIVVMNHGVIEQIGTPEAIYQTPRSRFVANFVGQMNFLPATITADHHLLIADAYPLSLSPRQQTALQRLAVGTRIEIGFRPEAATLLEVEASDVAARRADFLPTTLISQEFLGARTRLHLTLTHPRSNATTDQAHADHLLQIDTDPHFNRLTAGVTQLPLTIAIDPEQLHCFDQAGCALC
jgi:iron(III) transport system ATP-binding protein